MFKHTKKILTVLLCITLMLSLTCCSNKSIEFSSNNVTSENIVGSIPLVSQNSENKMIVHYIDVGQGDCIFVELPNQETLLIDAGTSKGYSCIIPYIEKLGYCVIDYVVATHPHADHIGSMSKILQKFKVNNFFMPECFPKTKMFVNMLNTVKLKEIPIYLGKMGMVITEQDDLFVEVLSPMDFRYSNINNYSLVIKIDYGESEFLFTGDAETLIEQELLDYEVDVDSDILKVGHHGSNTSSSKAFIENVSPDIAIISCGINNKYNHPHTETIQTFMNQDIEYYRTDELGTVIIEADKDENFLVITQKGDN